MDSRVCADCVPICPQGLDQADERRGRRGDDDDHEQRRPESDGDRARCEAGESRVEDDRAVAGDGLRDDQRGEHGRGEVRARARPASAGARAPRPSSTGPVALNAIVAAPTTITESQTSLIRSSSRRGTRPRRR